MPRYGPKPFQRWLWPQGPKGITEVAAAVDQGPQARGLTLWLILGPPPHLPACRQEAERAGLHPAAVLVVPVADLSLLHGRLFAALSVPQVAQVLVDARGSEARILDLLASAPFFAPLAQRRPGAGARLIVLGEDFVG